MELRISDLRVFTVQANFEWTFVRIYSGDYYGTGEAGPAPGLMGMVNGFRRLLVGEDAFKVNRIIEKLRYATLYSGTTTHHLIAGITIALYDLISKYLNVPLYKLLGGDRERIRVYVDAHGGKGLEAIDSLLLPIRLSWIENAEIEKDRLVTQNNPVSGRLSLEKWNEDYSPESYAKRARSLVNEGFTAIKFDLDIPTPFLSEHRVRSGDLSLKDIDYMAEIIRAVRDTVGDEIDIMVDLHWRYNVNTAIRICKALEPYRLRWIEDPTTSTIALTNFDELKIISSYCSIPIAVGETLYSSVQFKDLLSTNARVWTPDIAKTGIIEGRKISEIASIYDIEFSPHNIGSPIATMATAHLSSLSNTLGAVEFHGHDVPFWNDIIKPKRKIIEHGFITLTDEPGLGIDLDIDVMRKYWKDFEV
ncbi:mandelate racemase/muconate lactonizing enzyme family protein [Saccharolobus caldissimus]|uniref:Mandelate racemase/muconate lactonizing enzyme C-terminal domain-containing protein n=1 Tax=Saccharolobus caldissimus TaxID=1702097 RepID=A0AAQ4CV91_9CREN|nr:mandelate racemase/muconate lactonizing enzyme family protein [Saccharolobus caldissimus]BDB99722.1 hypothetical protein SACC_27390 [Saccharolobus caldissimus]